MEPRERSQQNFIVTPEAQIFKDLLLALKASWPEVGKQCSYILLYDNRKAIDYLAEILKDYPFILASKQDDFDKARERTETETEK